MENYKNLLLDDLENEVWVDAIGYDGIYNVSSLGRIKSLGRWVSNGKSERFVKEKIRTQVKVKDGRLTCPLSASNVKRSINVSAMIFFSFNPNLDYINHKYCVMHKNKIPYDNSLENLVLTTVSKSHSVNHVFGKLEHLHKTNRQRTIDYLKLTHKICKVCEEKKEIEKFEFGRNTCLKCRGKIKKENYIKKQQQPKN